MADTFPWQHGMFKHFQGGNAVLVLSCHGNFLRNLAHLFVAYIQQFISLESYFKIGHRVIKLLSVEVFDNILKLQSNITIK